MYVIEVALALCLSYIVLVYVFAWCFTSGPVELSWRSILLIAAVSVLIMWTDAHVHEKQLANRLQHMLSGAFVAYLACVLAARDVHLSIGRARFALLGALVVTFMGVGNELIEFFLQSYTPLQFSSSRIDTWLDLASNAAGIALAAACLTPFVAKAANGEHH